MTQWILFYLIPSFSPHAYLPWLNSEYSFDVKLIVGSDFLFLVENGSIWSWKTQIWPLIWNTHTYINPRVYDWKMETPCDRLLFQQVENIGLTSEHKQKGDRKCGFRRRLRCWERQNSFVYNGDCYKWSLQVRMSTLRKLKFFYYISL